MKYLRFVLSVSVIIAAVLWSRLILPWRNEPMPFSGWGDGAGGNATTLEGPVILLWFVTMFAFAFMGIKPHVQSESRFVRIGRWFANAMLFPVAIILVIYATNGKPVRFLALYGFVALATVWVYVDLKRPKKQHPRP